jgi:transposase-like protein
MPMNRIQLQPGLSLTRFLELYGTEEQCQAALEQTRWPDGFRCPQCGEQEHGLVHERRHRRYQCRSCRHQKIVNAATIMEANKLPLTKWLQTFYLIGDTKTGISSLSLKRKLGVNYHTAWLVHNKIMKAMSEREKSYVLRGRVQLDDAYLGGELNGGRAGRGGDQITRCRSSLPAPLIRLGTRFT